MDIIDLGSLEQLESLRKQQLGLIAYFSTPDCGVCKVIRPQIEQLLQEQYPQMVFAYVDVAQHADIAAQLGVLTVPTVILYFDGQENQRFVRNFSLGQVNEAIARPYQMLF
jgi:thioredoxin-like negative regulator of GroEL